MRSCRSSLRPLQHSSGLFVNFDVARAALNIAFVLYAGKACADFDSGTAAWRREEGAVAIVGCMPRRRKQENAEPRRRWRDYRSASGGRPVKKFIDRLSDIDAAEVVAAMKDVERRGLAVAQHLEGEIYEVKAEGHHQTFRILFAQEGVHDQVLLSLEGFSKKQQKTPREAIGLAKRRLRDWRSRSRKEGKR